MQNCYFQLTTCRDFVVAAAAVVVVVVAAAAVVVFDGGSLLMIDSIEMFLKVLSSRVNLDKIITFI